MKENEQKYRRIHLNDSSNACVEILATGGDTN